MQRSGDSKFYRFDDDAITDFVDRLESNGVKVQRKGRNIWITPL